MGAFRFKKERHASGRITPILQWKRQPAVGFHFCAYFVLIKRGNIFFLLTSPVKCLILQHIPELMAKGRDKKLIELRDEAPVSYTHLEHPQGGREIIRNRFITR